MSTATEKRAAIRRQYGAPTCGSKLMNTADAREDAYPVDCALSPGHRGKHQGIHDTETRWLYQWTDAQAEAFYTYTSGLPAPRPHLHTWKPGTLYGDPNEHWFCRGCPSVKYPDQP